MTFLITLAITFAVCIALKGAIHKCPIAFYVAAVAVDVLYFAAKTFGAPFWLWKPLFELIQECFLPLALFTVVMYIGCFGRDSKLSHWLRPIRAELSIIACLLVVGHMGAYLGLYLSKALAGSMKANVAVAFAIALALLILVLVLGITSFYSVKKLMKKETWTKVQKWAYAFFGLTYVHLMLMLAPAAMQSGKAAQASIAVYSLVFGVYAIWRIARAVKDKSALPQAN